MTTLKQFKTIWIELNPKNQAARISTYRMKSPMCILLSRRETRHTGLSLYLGEKLIIFNCQSKHLHTLMIPKLSRYFSRFPCDLPFLDFLINIFSSLKSKSFELRLENMLIKNFRNSGAHRVTQIPFYFQHVY